MTRVIGDAEIRLRWSQRPPRLQEMVVRRVRALLTFGLGARCQGRRQAQLLPALLAVLKSDAAVNIGEIIVIAMRRGLHRVVRPVRRHTDMEHDIRSMTMCRGVVLQDSRETFPNGRISDGDRGGVHMKGYAAVMITLGRREGERGREGRGDQIGGVDEVCPKGLVTRSQLDSDSGSGSSARLSSLTPNPVINTEISLGAGCRWTGLSGAECSVGATGP